MLGIGLKINQNKVLAFSPSPPTGSTVYWVGGEGNWSDAENHWAAESGGEPSVSNLPDSTTSVVFDENSGLENDDVIALDAGVPACYDFKSSTGHSYSITLGEAPEDNLRIYGSVELEEGFSIGEEDVITIVLYGAGNHTITWNNASIYMLYIYGSGTYTLLDDLIVEDLFQQENGIIDANDFNITTRNFVFTADDISKNTTLIMGSGTWEMIDDGCWSVYEDEGGVVTIVPEISTIKMLNSTGFSRAFDGSDKIYYNLWISGDPSIEVTGINDSNTFNDIKIDPGKSVVFQSLETQTVNTFTVVGTSENPIVLRGTPSAGSWEISCASGTINCDYLDIDYSDAVGGATFNAGEHSVDGGHNTGWIFT